MKRLPLLLTALLMFMMAGAIVFFGARHLASPISHQDECLAKAAFVVPLAVMGTMLLGFVIWVWALVHMLTNQRIQGTDKIVWVLVIIFLNALGAILYFFLCPSLRSPGATPPPPIK